MRRLLRLGAHHPWIVFVVLGLLTILASARLLDLEVHISAESMLEKGTPDWELLVDTEETFGSEDMVIVVVKDADLFTSEKLVAVGRMADAVANLPYVTKTASLFNAPNLQNVDGFIHTRPYLAHLPQSPAETASLKGQALRNPLVEGNLLAPDGNALAVNVFLTRDAADPAFDRRVTADLEHLIAPLRDTVGDAYQVGLPAIRADLSGKILADQRTFLPLSVLVLLTALALSLRRATAALLPLCTAAMSVVWTLGFMAFAGIPLNIMTSVVPALLVIVGSTEDIHLLAEYTAGTAEGQSRAAALERMADRMGMAVLLTFLTTYLGFLSIALNHIELLYQFGLVASTGLLFNFIITILLVPAMLGLGRERPEIAAPARRPGAAFQVLAVALLEAVQRRRRTVLIAAALLATAALAATAGLRINNNLLDYVDERSVLRDRVEQIHEDLSGVHLFSIVLSSGIEETFLQIRYLEELGRVQDFVDGIGIFDRSFSFVDFVALVDSVMAEENGTQLQLPESSDLVREYMLFVSHEDVASYVSPRYDKARIVVRHNIASSETLNAAVDQIRSFVRDHVDPALTVEITGKPILSNRAVEQMAVSQLQSLLMVGAVIVGLVSLLFVSVRAGLIALIPNLFAVVVLFGVMGLTGVPLNAGTTMVAAIALGICVDDTMHAMSRFHAELKCRETRQEALVAMVRAESVPIFATSLALAAGFAVFATSSFQPVVHFGLLSALVILVALVATFVLTPLLLSTASLLTVWDLLSCKVQDEALRRSELFRGMNLWQIKKVLLASEVRPFEADRVIIEEGTEATEMFLVLEGAVEVRKCRAGDSPLRIREIGVGGLFGEVGPVSGGLRTASVVTVCDTRVLVMSWSRVERLTRVYPFLALRLFRNLTRIVGARMTEVSRQATACDAPAAAPEV